MDKRLAEWFAHGWVGTSSKAIALWLSAKVRSNGPPSDPSDLQRCMLLLDRIPEWKSRMGEMAEAGDDWAPFAERWDELIALFIEEKGDAGDYGWSAPRTYELMREMHGRPVRKPGLHIELSA